MGLLRFFSSQIARRSAPAFVFDIDGVLVRGKKRLEAGTRALQALLNADGTSFRFPVMFLTNGGGVSEEQKAGEVTETTGVQVHADQVVLSHTPMAKLAAKYNAFKNSSVVCVGRRNCVKVAQWYGFERPIAIEDIARYDPLAVPNTFEEVTDEEPNLEVAAMSVASVMIMHDSRNWGRDIQLLCDILGSDGSPSRTQSNKQVVSLYASNPDFVYVNEYPLPRFGQGAFLTALRAVFKRRYGRQLDCLEFGKPNKSQYEFIEPLLTQRAKALGFDEISHIFAIGDNPEADVRGANRAGGKWVSVLVRTGCFTGGENDPQDPASIVVEDAYEAVKTVLSPKKSGLARN